MTAKISDVKIEQLSEEQYIHYLNSLTSHEEIRKVKREVKDKLNKWNILTLISLFVLIASSITGLWWTLFQFLFVISDLFPHDPRGAIVIHDASIHVCLVLTFLFLLSLFFIIKRVSILQVKLTSIQNYLNQYY